MTDAAPEVEKRRHRLALPRALPPVLRRSLPRSLPRPRPRLVAGAVLGVILIVAVAAPAVVSVLGLKGPLVRDPSALNLLSDPTGPGAAHPLGVDGEGRDVLSRMLYGLRSLVLVSLAGVGLAVLAGSVLARLVRVNRRVGRLMSWPLEALAAFPPLLLGLAFGLTLGAGVWRLILALVLTQLTAALALVPPLLSRASLSSRSAVALAARRLVVSGLVLAPGAVVIDFGLTFLGDGPGGSSPQLGAMVAQAGKGILAGVPAWWALLFPGLLVMVVMAAGALLAGGRERRSRPRPHLLVGARARFASGRLLAGVIEALLVLGLAAAMFTSLGGAGGADMGGPARVGPDLGATVSLLGGGAVVWLVATVVQIRLTTSVHRRAGRVVVWLVRVPAFVLNAAPVGAVAFLALYVFSENVGKLPVLPGAGTYVGLTHDPGQWAQSLVIPWLLLGLSQAARTTPDLQARVAAEAASAQQRVARAAGVPESTLSRQRRRALVAPVLEIAARQTAILLSLGVVIEATFKIPGIGALAVSDFGHARAPTVSDVATLGALLTVVVGVLVDLVRVLVDPRVASA